MSEGCSCQKCSYPMSEHKWDVVWEEWVCPSNSRDDIRDELAALDLQYESLDRQMNDVELKILALQKKLEKFE